MTKEFVENKTLFKLNEKVTRKTDAIKLKKSIQQKNKYVRVKKVKGGYEVYESTHYRIGLLNPKTGKFSKNRPRKK